MAVHHIQLADATLAFVTSPHILYARTVSQVGNDAAQLGRPDGGQTEKPRKGTKSNTICFFVSVRQSRDERLTGAWWDSSSRPWPRTDSPILCGRSGSPKGCGKERRKLSGSVGCCYILWGGALSTYSSTVMWVSEGRIRAMVAVVTSPSLLLDKLEERRVKLKSESDQPIQRFIRPYFIISKLSRISRHVLFVHRLMK